MPSSTPHWPNAVSGQPEEDYAGPDLFDRPRLPMDDWSTYLAGAHHPQSPIAEPAEQEVAGNAAP